ncbi:MAG: polysaccharide export protein [Merismopedia sp. SIO2A8]|nr:polysaccharide export protein [Merismopedia sp. SIO2A8]
MKKMIDLNHSAPKGKSALLPPFIPLLSAFIAVLPSIFGFNPAQALPLSPGDRVRLTIAEDQDLPATDRFSGIYEVDLDGTLRIPFLAPLPVVGDEFETVEQTLRQVLVQGGFFHGDRLQLSLAIVQWAPIQVSVEGATYRPGQVLTNSPPNATPNRQFFRGDPPYTITGNYPPARYLTVVLQQAGGVQPTADIENIQLHRDGNTYGIDLSGVLTGAGVEDVPLIAGDRITVPTLATPQPELMRPSQITPATVDIFVANQTAPSNNDRLEGEVAELDYGSRLSQAAVAMRCAGGTRSTNAKRRIALIRTDRLSGATEVVDQKVEALLRESTGDSDNPFLLPSDSVVCYDSRFTNIARIVDVVGDFLNPLRIIDDIFD